MKYFFLIGLLSLSIFPVFGQQMEYFSPENIKKYDLVIDDNKFSISYQTDANVISMDIDQESKSLLIGLQNTSNSIFVIELDKKLINSINNDFVVLVDGVDYDYSISTNDKSSTLKFFVPTDSEEIEIIGTSAIPEFPLGIFFLVVIIMTGVIITTKYNHSIFRL